MFFSIIIPVYNVESYLRDCLDSVLRQTFSDWEAICVDDGSTDGSSDILADYASRDSRIRVVTQPNSGLSAARNTGLDHAQGKYILFLDSDDWLSIDALNRIYGKTNDDEDFVAFNGCLYYQESSFTDVADTLDEISHPTGWDYYISHVNEHRRFAFTCAVIRCYRKQFLIENQLYFKDGILHEDNLFTPIVCYYAQKVKQINDVIYYYRIRQNSIMTTRGQKHNVDMIVIANTLSSFFTAHRCERKDVVFRQITIRYQSAFFCSRRKEDKQLTSLVDWQLYHKVSRTRPRHRLNYLLIRFCPSLYRWVYSHI